MKRVFVLFCVAGVVASFSFSQTITQRLSAAPTKNQTDADKAEKLKMGWPISFRREWSGKMPDGMGNMWVDKKTDYTLEHAYGYWYSLKYTLKVVKEKYPDLYGPADKNFKEFETKFASGLTSIKSWFKAYKLTNDKDKIQKLLTSSIATAKESLATREGAEKMCKKIADAAQGNLPDKVLCIIYRSDPQCRSKPETEMDLPKGSLEFEEFAGKGRLRVRMTLEHPASWIQVDQKDRMFSDVEFHRPYDKFSIMFIPIISNAKLGLKGVTNNSIWNSPNGPRLLDWYIKNLQTATLIKQGKCNINSRQWGWAQISLTNPKLDNEFTTQCFFFMTICDDKVVIMLFACAIDKDKVADMGKVQDYIGPACRRIIQTVKIRPAVKNKNEEDEEESEGPSKEDDEE